MSAEELVEAARYLAALARVQPETATVWLHELTTQESIELAEARRIVSVVCRRRVARGPLEISELVREARTGELSRAETGHSELRTKTEGYLALGSGRPAEVDATIARVALAVALSGATRGRTDAEVRDEMRTLYRQPERVAEVLAAAEVDTEDARRAKARRLAAEPYERPAHWETEEQIQARTKAEGVPAKS